MSLSCNVNFLLKDELIHELNIRNIPASPEDTCDELRGYLRKSIKLARRGSIRVSPGSVLVDPVCELGVLSPKVSELTSQLSSGDRTNVKRPRWIGRINYLLERLARIDQLSPELLSLRASLVRCLSEHEGVTDSSSESEVEEPKCCKGHRTVIRDSPVKFNLLSLNLKFNGSSCVRSFVNRLDELRLSRQIPVQVVFDGFIDLLDGPALDWYRAYRNTFKTYAQLIDKLKLDFDSPDYDYRLRKEIESRTQHKKETMVVYLATILGMMSRLPKPLLEEDQLEIILRNVRPEYRSALALTDVKSIDELQKLCRKIELVKFRNDNFAEPAMGRNKAEASDSFAKPSTSKGVMYNNDKFDSRNNGTFQNRLSSVRLHCFRCNRDNHSTRDCKVSRELLCYRCGLKGVKTPDCPKCNQAKN